MTIGEILIPFLGFVRVRGNDDTSITGPCARRIGGGRSVEYGGGGGGVVV